jgi:para-aminobenzoate synthetase/4-amino-4-deoxychorismate lyase
VRLTLSRNGEIILAHEAVKPSRGLLVALSGKAIQSDDEFLRHKTTHRDVYERALLAHPGVQDVLLWNERGELTETCHGNVVLEIGGRRLTPPVSSGLLPGVFRASLLDRGEIEEKVLPVELLKSASSVFMINSVRQWCEVRVVGLDRRASHCDCDG